MGGATTRGVAMLVSIRINARFSLQGLGVGGADPDFVDVEPHQPCREREARGSEKEERERRERGERERREGERESEERERRGERGEGRGEIGDRR